MTGQLLYAVCKELMALPELGLKQVQIARNFTTNNPPQNVLPAAIVGILEDESSVFVGGYERREYEIGISISILDTNIDLAHSSDWIVDKYKGAYDIPDRTQTLFNRQVFTTPQMQKLLQKNNLITRSRGYNLRHTPYDKWSKNVVTYELVVRAILTVPMEEPEVPIEDIKYEFEVTV